MQACSTAQLGLTLCKPMDCSSWDSSVYGIIRARTPEWLRFPAPGDLPDPHLLCLLHWQADSLLPCHLGSQYPEKLAGALGLRSRLLWVFRKHLSISSLISTYFSWLLYHWEGNFPNPAQLYQHYIVVQKMIIAPNIFQSTTFPKPLSELLSQQIPTKCWR